MLVNFDSDEYYPFYFEVPADAKWKDGTVELTEEELQDFRLCMQKMEEWQKILRDKIRGY